MGYSDLYTLRKEDLWLVLDNYPESLSKIIEKGKSILRKDNLLDESLMDSKRYIEQEQLLSVQNRIKKLVDADKTLNDRISTFFESYVESIQSFKKQLSKMEYYYELRKPSVCVTKSAPVTSGSESAVPFFLNQWKSNTTANLFKFRRASSLQLDDD